jgi:hypothetical protein
MVPLCRRAYHWGMPALELPIYPTRARCACTHGLYAHSRPNASRCAAEGCSCRRFDAAGGLVPLEIEHFEARPLTSPAPPLG